MCCLIMYAGDGGKIIYIHVREKQKLMESMGGKNHLYIHDRKTEVDGKIYKDGN